MFSDGLCHDTSSSLCTAHSPPFENKNKLQCIVKLSRVLCVSGSKYNSKGTVPHCTCDLRATVLDIHKLKTKS